MDDASARGFLRRLFDAAIAEADPARVVPRWLPEPPKGRTIVVGAGKASAAMARAFEANWPGELKGLVVTRYGHAAPCKRIEIVEADHPVPDERGRDAARRILEMVRGLAEDDLVVALISGGASALLTAPAEGLTLADKQAVNRALLASGASIDEMNCLRKHLSAIKGGRLAAAAFPARVLTLLISDVPGDDPATIGSGPTVADPTSFADARAIVAKYGVVPPPAVAARLAAADDETPKPDDPRIARAETRLIATPQVSLMAAAAVARAEDVAPVILGDAIEGESREVARVFAGIARQTRRYGQPVPPPCVLLSGGETTVTMRGKGRGGRNSAFLLALAIALQGQAGTFAIAGDTDGVDGSEDNAGAILTPDTLARAAAKGVDAKAHLAGDDAYSFFSALGDLVVTGPTLTNVNDFRAIFVDQNHGGPATI